MVRCGGEPAKSAAAGGRCHLSLADAMVAILEGPPPPPGDRSGLATLLSQGPPEDVELELRRLAAVHARPHVRAHARRLLSGFPTAHRRPRLSPEADRETLRAALADPDVGVRQAAGEGAARLEAPDARELALQAVRRPEPEAWLLSGWVTLLGEVGEPQDADELAVVVGHPVAAVQGAALGALAKLSPDTGTYAALRRQRAEDPVVRVAALRILAARDPDQAGAVMLETARSPHWWMRSAALSLLDAVPPRAAEAVCVELLLREDDPTNLARALAHLGTTGGRRGAGALLALRDAEEPTVQAAARRAFESVRARLGMSAPALDEELQSFRRARLAALAATLAEVAVEPPADAPPAPPPDLLGSAPHDPDGDERPGERAAAEAALAALAEGDPGEPLADLEAAVQAGGVRLTTPVRLALALARLRQGERGAALVHVQALDPARLRPPHLYVLARALEAAEAPGEARRLYAAIESTGAGYRDAASRSARLPAQAGLPERAWSLLGEHFDNLVPLGRGGMGCVYRARDRRRDRDVAVKVPDEQILEDPRVRTRFLLEMEALAGLDHPGVVRVLDVAAGELPYYSMELEEGGTLGDLLGREGPLTAARALDLFTPLASALAHIHGVGIVHRDLKPANVLVGEGGALRLTDFGLAYEERRSDAHEAGKAVGTLAYMAPEQLQGEAPTPAADVYSFGVMLFEALAGELPFRVIHSLRKLQDPAPRLSELGREVPPALEAAVARSLELFPWDRPETGRELAEALREVRGSG